MAFTIVGGKAFVDTDFVNESQHKVRQGNLRHLGFGDFALEFAEDTNGGGFKVVFRRAHGMAQADMPVIPGQSGRCHLVEGTRESVSALLLAMGADAATVGGLT